MATTERLHFGARPISATETRFRVWAPSQRRLTLETGDSRRFELDARDGGWFESALPLPAGTAYRYLVEQTEGSGTLAIPDPASRLQDGDVHDASVVVDLSTYAWQNVGWQGRPWEETVLYELHVGLLGGYTGVEARLAGLAALGVTAIELMPLNDFPGARNWGYDGVLPYAPDAAYGSPDELRHLIDAAHGLGLMVFLDVVYNHFGPDGNYLGLLAPGFYRDDLKTPWGSAIDFRRPEVRAFFTENAIQWLVDYRFDGLRLDAVHAISESDWLDEMALAVRAAVPPGRRVHLVLENDDNVQSHLEPKPHRFDAQWNDDAHHALHTLLTGEAEGYYGDYAGRPAEHLARVLGEGFAYQGQASANRDGRPRGTPSGHLPPTAFVDCLQNHDQTGNRALGDRLTTLADRQALEAAVALLLLSPHIPLLFMGEEVGSRTPFLFFTSHHGELAALVRAGRRNEFAKFPAFADPDLRERIPDPNEPATFDASRPEPGPDGARWQALYQRLLGLRHERLVPHLAGARSLGAHVLGPQAVSAAWELGDGSRLVLAVNFGPSPVAFENGPPATALLFATVADEGADIPPRCARCYLVAPALPEGLRELAEAAGIAVDWVDFTGRPQTVSAATVSGLLAALGHASDGPQAIARSLADCRSVSTQPAMVTVRVGEPVCLPWPDGGAALRVVLTTEGGASRELLPLDPPVEQRTDPPTRCFAGVDEPGYHRLELHCDQAGGAVAPRTLALAVAPARAYDAGLGRAWGTAVQVYALRPASSHAGVDPGLGDFSALAAFTASAGEVGAHFVATSPTHAGFVADPSQFSPYSPSSRLFHNPLLIDPAAPFGADAAAAAAASAGIGAELQALQGQPTIDWLRAGRLKLRWLRALFDQQQPADDPAAPLPAGTRLHAVFEALHAHFGAQGLGSWRDWPEPFRSPASAGVAAFADQHPAEIRFHAWLQQSADRGLEQAQTAATAAAMRIGLIADVAIGMTGAGSHAWSLPADLLPGFEIGAPPDLLNSRGQAWGLAAFSPPALMRSGFAPFIATLRAAMRHAGGVRIDHVLGLNRLWMVPQGRPASEGAYLHYPLRDLINLTILESHRHRAIVIGEDLGTVPEGLRDTLAAAGISGMQVLWLDRTPDGIGFLAPDQWSHDAIAMTTTHDLPTVAGWWQGRDLDWRERLGTGGDDPDAARRLRVEEKAALAAMVPGVDAGADGVDLAIELIASTRSRLAVVPIEDLLGLVEQPNLPGTIDEHPNWRQRLPLPADRLFSEEPARHRVARLTTLRSGPGGSLAPLLRPGGAADAP